MEITASLVKELRERTGAGMMDCKKALGETAGDMEAAIDWLRTKGLAAAAKTACRTCPVARQCAQEGADEYHGVWGGITPVERGNARSRGQRLRVLDVYACTDCDARVWAPKQTATTGYRCDQCRADDEAVA